MRDLFSDVNPGSGRPPATALVIFGATGDLTRRKLIPALYNLAHDGYLPPEFVVVGAARTQQSDQEFRDKLFNDVKQFSRREVRADLWESFAQRLHYQSLNGNDLKDFCLLKERLEALTAGGSGTYNYLYYLATSPNFFGPIAANLKAADLVFPMQPGHSRSSLIVEKPFGENLTSARELNQVLRENFSEQQIFRIDHYLGKETVQNILVFRFANGLFESIWNRKYIEQIQISVCESIGVGSRAGYFDSSGITRDIVQNHLLQMLSLLCIDPPISLKDADSIRDEKVKVLRSIQRVSPELVRDRSVRAQYTKGYISGDPVCGYLEEDGIASSSSTESFVAMQFEIDNWRWAGVPIYVRAGKRLPKRVTEITIFFHKPPAALFRGHHIKELEPNVLAIQVQPNEGISLRINSKPPGPRMEVKPVEMDFSYGTSFGVSSADAYERLLLDAMKGDATLFTRDDEIEEAWDLLAPFLDAWNGDNAPPVYRYEAGSWGPIESELLLAKNGHRWRQL
ncbi:MAG: glucose-6-phosphate dehydrogenase [Bdellovibrionales bacterium]|nr:glucose-6-phosphate dehydrogenase [Bdellovibrionales bacterium]